MHRTSFYENETNQNLFTESSWLKYSMISYQELLLNHPKKVTMTEFIKTL